MMMVVAMMPDTTEREPASIRQTTARKPITQRIPLMILSVAMKFLVALESILAAIEAMSAENSFLRAFAR